MEGGGQFTRQPAAAVQANLLRQERLLVRWQVSLFLHQQQAPSKLTTRRAFTMASERVCSSLLPALNRWVSGIEGVSVVMAVSFLRLIIRPELPGRLGPLRDPANSLSPC